MPPRWNFFTSDPSGRYVMAPSASTALHYEQTKAGSLVRITHTSNANESPMPLFQKEAVACGYDAALPETFRGPLIARLWLPMRPFTAPEFRDQCGTGLAQVPAIGGIAHVADLRSLPLIAGRDEIGMVQHAVQSFSPGSGLFQS